MLGQNKMLTKLKIAAYRDRERTPRKKVGELDVMYNPDTLTLSYHNEYRTDDYCSDIKSNTFYRSHAGALNLTLIIDAKMPENRNGVADQIKQLKTLCYRLDTGTLEPRFLSVSWGKLSMGIEKLYTGRIKDFSVNYTAFDRDGSPLRAEINLTLIEDSKFQQKEDIKEDIKKADSNVPNSIEVYVGGTQLQQLSLMRMTSTQRVNGIPVAQLQLSMPGGWQDSIASEVTLCNTGAEVKISSVKSNEFLFKGIITAHSLDISKGDKVLTLKLQHPLIRLDNRSHSQVFFEKNDKQIISNLCRGPDIGTIHYSGNIQKKMQQFCHEQKVQFRCTDWHFIRSCLDANGAWLVANPDKIEVIAPQLSNPQPDHQLHAQKGDKVYNASWTFTATDQPKALEMSSWDIKLQKLQTQKASAPSLGYKALEVSAKRALTPKSWSTHYSTPKDKREIKAWADSALVNFYLAQAQGEFELAGTTKYRLGQAIAFSGFGTNVDGTAIITSVAHTIMSSEWKTQITIGSGGLADSLTPLPSTSGMHMATVAKYKQDLKSFDRIGVHVHALGADNQKNKLWARFAMPYASKQSGLYCYPEPGDEVVIGFIEENPCYPVILGALHNPINKPALTPDMAQKGWKINQGDAELGMLLNVDEKTLVLNSGKQSIEINDTDKNNKVAIQSSDLVTITSDKDTSITGTDSVTITSDKDTSITGKDSVTITSDKDTSITGKDSVTITGKAISLNKQ